MEGLIVGGWHTSDQVFIQGRLLFGRGKGCGAIDQPKLYCNDSTSKAAMSLDGIIFAYICGNWWQGVTKREVRSYLCSWQRRIYNPIEHLR